MIVVEKNPVPIYEAVCGECKSTIQYRAAEVRLGSYITCPVCGKSIYAPTIMPVRWEET